LGLAAGPDPPLFSILISPMRWGSVFVSSSQTPVVGVGFGTRLLVGLVPLVCLRRIGIVFLDVVACIVVFEPQGNASLFLGGVNVLAQHGLDSGFDFLIRRLCVG
jgi:hypothetical protein